MVHVCRWLTSRLFASNVPSAILDHVVSYAQMDILETQREYTEPFVCAKLAIAMETAFTILLVYTVTNACPVILEIHLHCLMETVKNVVVIREELSKLIKAFQSAIQIMVTVSVNQT
ncbi:hypothetical protein pipiens_013997 [Culex pipiens pipiens]|uniref:Uncharacterized protein n=1 Tax=Culex pipiens pipiens TaxID=38569 RepID=A0ABD1CW89_CULPP